MTDRRRLRLPPDPDAPEKSTWALLPRGTLRRVLALVATLVAIVAFKRCSGPWVKAVGDVLAPPVATGAAGGRGGVAERAPSPAGGYTVRMKVPPSGASGSVPDAGMGRRP